MKSVVKLISSKAFLIWLIGGWILYYVTYAVWGKEAFAGFVYSIEKNPVFQGIYVLFLLSLVSNIVRSSIGRAEKGVVHLITWVVLPSGMFLFLCGFFLSASSRDVAQLLAGDGDNIKPKWLARPYAVKKIVPSLKEETLDIETDKGIFTREPKIILTRDGKDFEVGAYPPKNIDGTYFHILNFGVAPGVRLMDKTGNVLKEGYMALRVLPPGTEDSFEMPPYPYKVSIRFAPERVIEKGGSSFNVYSLKSPSFHTTVYKGQDMLFEGNSKGGVKFNDLTLAFFEPTYWVILDISKDHGVRVIIAGILLITIGVPLRLFGMALSLRRA